MFTYDPPAPPEVVAAWQDRLDGICPRSDAAGWLRMRWMPGEPWAPVQRWVIDEMVPHQLLRSLAADAERDQRRLVYGLWLSELDGPHPTHRWDAIAGQVRRGRNQAVARFQWELWRAERCWAQPVWVVQGPYGGHKRWYDDLEQRVAAMGGLPTSPPRPGALRYVEPSEATFTRLAAYDRIRQAKQDLRLIRSGRQFRLASERIMASLLRDIYTHVEAVYYDTRSLRDLDDLPRSERDPVDYAEWERLEESFIHTN